MNVNIVMRSTDAVRTCARTAVLIHFYSLTLHLRLHVGLLYVIVSYFVRVCMTEFADE